MAFDASEFDEFGRWTGTCAECGTSHDGLQPGTLGGDMACVRARTEALGAGHLVDQVDAGRRDLHARRDQILRDMDLIPYEDRSR